MDDPAAKGQKPQITERRAADFLQCFDLPVLAGDASLAETHIELTLKAVREKRRDSNNNLLVVAEVLFKVVILRSYLGCTVENEVEIFYLALKWESGLKVDSHYTEAKNGHILRNLTLPEQALAAGEGSSDTRHPPVPIYATALTQHRTSQISVQIDKGCSLDIPKGFLLAGARCEDGRPYQWLAQSESTTKRRNQQDGGRDRAGKRAKKEENVEGLMPKALRRSLRTTKDPVK